MSMSIEEDIKLAVERAAAMSVMHLRSVPVTETFRGEVVWQGIVEVFALPSKHPSTAYGWPVSPAEKTKFATVLGLPPINSPQDAVRSWLASRSGK